MIGLKLFTRKPTLMRILVNAIAAKQTTHSFSVGGVSCSIQELDDMDALDFGDYSLEGHYVLCDIGLKSGKRAGNGDGTACLKQAQAFVHSKGKALVCHPYVRDSGKMNQAQLEKWYERNGFIEQDGYWISYP